MQSRNWWTTQKGLRINKKKGWGKVCRHETKPLASLPISGKSPGPLCEFLLFFSLWREWELLLIVVFLRQIWEFGHSRTSLNSGQSAGREAIFETFYLFARFSESLRVINVVNFLTKKREREGFRSSGTARMSSGLVPPNVGNFFMGHPLLSSFNKVSGHILILLQQ